MRTGKWRLWVTLVCGFCAAFLPGSARGECVLKGIRFSPAGKGFRVVADLSETVAFNTLELANPDRIAVDMHPCVAGAGAADISVGVPPLIRIRAAQNDEFKIRMVLELNTMVEYNVFLLSGPPRVVVDIGETGLGAQGPIQAPVPQTTPQPETIPSGQAGSGNGFKYASEILQTDSGPVRIYTVKITPEYARKIRVGINPNGIGHTSPLSQLAANSRARVAINGGFFHSNNILVGLRVIKGRIVGAPALNRPSFGISNNGEVRIFTPALKIYFTWRGGERQYISTVNEPLQVQNAVIYSPEYAMNVDYPDNYHISLLGELITDVSYGEFSPRKYSNYVVALHRYLYEQLLKQPKVGNRAEIIFDMDPPADSLAYAIEGGPTLVRNGRISINTSAERFKPGSVILNGKQPRTAVGITIDGSVLWVVADGRQESSCGMTIREMAEFMVRKGAEDAMLLDGGGSSTLWINGHVVNSPSGGSERPIPDFLYLP